MIHRLLLIPAVLVAAASGKSALAQSDPERVQALERRVELLEARIASLEAHRAFTSFMPDFAERFHVMHIAGEAGDWAVASHELQEMLRLSALSTAIDSEKGALLQGMMAPSFEALGGAIEHGNAQKFEQAFAQAINTCNACHAATGSSFVEVTLNDSSAMSPRHPHKLTPRAVSSGHTHGRPAAAAAGLPVHGRASDEMHGHAETGKGRDDTGEPAHAHCRARSDGSHETGACGE